MSRPNPAGERPPRIQRPLQHLAVTALLAVAACATAQRAELDHKRDSMSARVDAGHFETVLQQLDLDRFGFDVPPLESRSDPAEAAYWTTRALVWAPEVRAARREWYAAIGELASAGAPAALALQVVDHEFGGDDELVEAIGVLDVFGLLRVGPSRAERRTASAAATLAMGQFELAAWRGMLATERARISRVAALARAARLAALVAEAREDLARVAILQRTGRLGTSAAEAATAAVELLARRRSLALDEAERRTADLMRASGVPSDDPALRAAAAIDGPPVAWLRDEATRLVAASGPDATPDGAAHPVLREARLTFALREAQVREAAAASWPSLSLGPHVGVLEEANVGAVMRLTLPFPSSWRGRLNAAVERREAAIEAYNDADHHLRVAEADATARMDLAAARLAGETDRVERATAAGWAAARASFRLGRGTIPGWVEALRMRGESATLAIDDAEAAALAALERHAARGPRRRSPDEVES